MTTIRLRPLLAGLPGAPRGRLDVRLDAVHDLALRLAGEREDRLDAEDVGRVEHDQRPEPALPAAGVEVPRQVHGEDLDVEMRVIVVM